HRFRRLAADDLGYHRGSEKRGLSVKAGALAAGVAKRGERQRSFVVQGSGYLRPSFATALRQRTSLVRPIGWMNRRLFEDDDANATGRPALVVGQVAPREVPSRTEISLVRAKNNAI